MRFCILIGVIGHLFRVLALTGLELGVAILQAYYPISFKKNYESGPITKGYLFLSSSKVQKITKIKVGPNCTMKLVLQGQLTSSCVCLCGLVCPTDFASLIFFFIRNEDFIYGKKKIQPLEKGTRCPN